MNTNISKNQQMYLNPNTYLSEEPNTNTNTAFFKYLKTNTNLFANIFVNTEKMTFNYAIHIKINMRFVFILIQSEQSFDVTPYCSIKTFFLFF